MIKDRIGAENGGDETIAPYGQKLYVFFKFKCIYREMSSLGPTYLSGRLHNVRYIVLGDGCKWRFNII